MDEPDWRNLTPADEGILSGKLYVIHDREPLFTDEFLTMLADTGVKSVRLPPNSPNLNAFAERFVRSIKEPCLERMILFGEASLRKAIQEFVAEIKNWRVQKVGEMTLSKPLPGSGFRRGSQCRRARLQHQSQRRLS